MNCEFFRQRFEGGTEDPALLEHVRTCDGCLEFASSIDPDILFRSLGGGELVPPGGVDAFVDDVMQQVRVRAAEKTLVRPRVVSWPRRLAVAATLVAGVTGAMLFNRADVPQPQLPGPAAIARSVEPVTAAKLATKPVVETYQSAGEVTMDSATIVEMPAEDTGDDVKIVMIFDENLPADL